MWRTLILTLLTIPAVAQAELQISDAWIKHLPPTVPVRAGYMTIHNSGDSAQRIVGADSESFGSVEIHESLMQDGMMRMERREVLVIEAGATLRLEPGGLHLMLMMPAQPTEPGEVHRVRLRLGDGSTRALDMTVKK